MHIEFLRDVFVLEKDKTALVWNGREFSYQWLNEKIDHWSNFLHENSVVEGAVVALEGDFSPNSVSLLLALIEHRCVIVPLSKTVESKRSEFLEIANAEFTIRIDSDDSANVDHLSPSSLHTILQNLKKSQRPGLVLFSSGSTGKSKAAVHDFVPLLEKFKVRRQSKKTLTFLLFDHIGGINTLLYTLSNGGTIVTVETRSPDHVCAAVERYKVQILPTSPTFLNLVLISEAYKRHDLSSLELITYGTEVMPESTLKRLSELFPNLKLQQTYGLSEIGIMRSKSRSSDSLWVKVGGEGYETRIVDGLLEIKAASAMLGYLNADSPFTADGWFKTGDAVETDGDWLKILGRKSEIINVGGEKVFPAEVESALQTLSGVLEVTVKGEKNPITGYIVTAKFRISTQETLPEFRTRMRKHCMSLLAPYKIPQKITLVEETLHGERFKKMR